MTYIRKGNREILNRGRYTWDYLVLATGAQANVPRIPGLAEHVPALKPLTDAQQIHNQITWGGMNMLKATDELRKTHKLVRKVLNELSVGSARFHDVLKTLHRTMAAHVYFIGKIFIPALNNVPLIDHGFIGGIVGDHKDIDRLIKVVRKMSLSRDKELDAYCLQIQTMIEAVFLKEEQALYVLAEEFLDPKKLFDLAEEMDRRKEEIRNLVDQ